MSVVRTARVKLGIAAAVFALLPCAVFSQTAKPSKKPAEKKPPAKKEATRKPLPPSQAAAQSALQRTRQILISNAHALESRGRPDMAVQVWQQVLLSDPNNAEALAGLARDLRMTGQIRQSQTTLEKLKKVNPNSPEIGKIQGLTTSTQQNGRLRQAGALAAAGHNEDAMRIYRELYGDHPPDGDVGLAYYETLYGTIEGKQQAMDGMRGLMNRNPGDPRYAIALGRMLSYDPRTRAEGIRILQAHANDADAHDALRQALLWDADNPRIVDELKAYLKTNPGDAVIASRLHEDEAKLAQMNSGIARSVPEQQAFFALNRHQFDLAQKRFMAILDKNPKNPRAAAGMGFLRMQQNNFAGAISYLTQAEENGFKARVVENALETSRFWFTMGEASDALKNNQFELAAQKYQQALTQRPTSPDALNGLAGLYMREQQYSESSQIYERLLKIAPRDPDTWRNLFLSYARDGQNAKALAIADRIPATVRPTLNRDPDYLRTLSTIYQTTGHPAEAQRVLSQALALPFPDNGAQLKSDTRLQYAGILMEARRYGQAAAMYQQMLRDDPTNLSAWMGIVSAHHQLNLNSAAIADLQRMPPTVYESALGDPGFLSMLAAIYQEGGQYDIAQSLLERSMKVQSARGIQPTLQTQLQLAAIYQQRNDSDHAYQVYRQILTAYPARVDAWKGLIGALQAGNHVQEAIQQIAYIPPAVRTQLDGDIDFQSTLASLYAAAGDTAHATYYMNRVERHFAQLRQLPPAGLSIQHAWLLYNTKNDGALYPALMQLGGRTDLTPEQRRTVQTIWANWAVRRAGAALDNNQNDRAVQILEAADSAFPDNPQVRLVLAGGYLRVGRARDALAIYKSVPLDNATATDLQGAIGSALAATDRAQAEIWLRQALQKFPNNAGILGMAARFEQARGDNQRAADYWRAAIAAMPAGSPANRLAHELDYPEQSTATHKAVTANDLQRLLNPGNEPFAKVTELPPLPSYGPDPYVTGAVPAPLGAPQTVAPPLSTTSPQTAAEQAPMLTAPATTLIPAPQPTPPAAPVKAPTPQSSKKTKNHRRSSTGLTGQMHLTPSEENVESTTPPAEIAPAQAAPASSAPVFIPRPQAEETEPEQPATPQNGAPEFVPVPQVSSNPQQQGQPPLQLSSQPMDAQAAQTQARFADQTDAQLTQGSAPVRALGNAPIQLPSDDATQPAPQTTEALAGAPPAIDAVQYTPSAQEAASGAYSVAKQPLPSNTTQQNTKMPKEKEKPKAAKGKAQKQSPGLADRLKKTIQGSNQQPATTSSKSAAKRKPRKKAAPMQQVPTLVTAPAEQTPSTPPVQPQPSYTEQQPEQAPAEQGLPGVSDQELQQRNLPPLRGPWVKVRRQQQPLSPREEAEQQLAGLESSYSGWLAGTGLIDFRSGNLGYDRLAALQAPFEASAPLGYNGRITLVVKPVFLDSGQADGTAITTVQESTTGGTGLVTIPEPLGTDLNTGPNATAGTTGTPPPQQNAAGIGGELQLAFPHFSIGGGYSPYGFLVSNWIGHLYWRPANGPFTFTGSRDSIMDSQLSFGGLRDPGNASLSYPGTIWGGVIANQGNVQFTRGDAQSGFYLGAGGQYITGYNVQTNSRVDGSGGAYWRVHSFPEYGTLNVGTNFFAMHYAHNENAFTFGMGGYFSPQFYLLANIPVTWEGHYLTKFHYEILTGIGVQAFQQDATPLFPLAAQKASEIALNNAMLPALTSVGANYDLRVTGAYQLTPHWFAGGFLTGNNSRNYNEVSAGFSIHYMFRAQPATVTTPTGLFPWTGLRPFSVP
ncbi:MAG: cellulose synthase subunit BcsC-related outer membrane protein [Acidobacteriota bacterium]